MKEYVNVFYFYHINSIGGVETFFNELVNKYADEYDITILYNSADPQQLQRLKSKVRYIKFHNQRIKCKRLFMNYNTDVINYVDAEEYIEIIHADYSRSQMKLQPPCHPKITKYISVSELARSGLLKVSDIDSEVCYNPVTLKESRKVLRLVSATRLTVEKGRDRLEKLARLLTDNRIPYIWTVFTNDTRSFSKDLNIVLVKPTLDITPYLDDADYVVQLSSSESYCYTVVESLLLKTPVIVTDLPIYKELGIDDKYGFILPLSMDNVPVQEIYDRSGSFKFPYTPPDDNWDDYLVKSKSDYDPNKKYKVRATNMYNRYNLSDSELGIIPKKGYEFEVDQYRLEILTHDNHYHKKFVEVVEAL